MKYLILAILLVSGLMAQSVETDRGVKQLTVLTEGDKAQARIDFRLALYHQKNAKRLVHQTYRPNYQPYITVVNASSHAFNGRRINVGSWNTRGNASIVRTGASVIHKIYNQRQVTFMMGKDFDISYFWYRGDKVFYIQDKH